MFGNNNPSPPMNSVVSIRKGLLVAPNGMRLRRLSRMDAPPHLCAPETCPSQPRPVRANSWSEDPGPGPFKMPVSSYCWRP